MVHRCCISSCGMNVRVAEAKGLSYHGFPNKEPLREQWIQAIIPHLDKPEAFKLVPKYTRVCSRHFRKKDYSVDIKKRARLNSNAVPTVFPKKNFNISIFSTEDEGLSIPAGDVKLEFKKEGRVNSNLNEIMSQIVGIGLNDRGGPTVLEIENLANHLNNSLLTEINSSPITLSIELEGLHLPRGDSGDTQLQEPRNTPVTVAAKGASSSQENIFMNDVGIQRGRSSSSSPLTSRKKRSGSVDVKLVGVTKKHKKDKLNGGKFSVERFSNSDKDIEYYTGFSSYKNFEAFFRSLEAYVERLRVTDVLFGVANLDKLQSSFDLWAGENSTEPSGGPITSEEGRDPEFVLPLPPPPATDEKTKRRPFHGRSMTRIDELFMTVIRLRRKLPEKVLGHMFYISQPTVSRIIRAWTVLLSKLIDCYPSEENVNKSKAGKSTQKSNNPDQPYTSRGLGIPECFRQLFHSELANSILISSQESAAKALQNKSIPTPTTVASNSKCTRRHKKSREEDPISSSSSGISPPDLDPLSSPVEVLTESEISDLLDPSSNPMFNSCVNLDPDASDFFSLVS